VSEHEDTRLLRDAREAARSVRLELTDEYLSLVEAVEALPDNQPGSDKTHRDPAGGSRRSLDAIGPLRPGRP
jgi:hypothetical protein